MKKILLIAAFVLAISPAFAAPKVTAANVVSIGQRIVNDFTAAQTMSGPAATPVDPVGYACYTTAVTSLHGISTASPNGIISTGEAIWLLVQTANTLATNSACQQTCGRVQMLAAKAGGLLGGILVPNVCGLFTSLAE